MQEIELYSYINYYAKLSFSKIPKLPVRIATYLKYRVT